MLSNRPGTFLLAFIFVCISCNQPPAEQETDSIVQQDQILEDVKYLASDKLEGRETGSEGNRLAQKYITERFDSLGLVMFDDRYLHSFKHSNPRNNQEFSEAVNLIGAVEGSESPHRYIVVTAHYDHLGIREGEIYNGADDNASGVGGLLASARYFTDNKPKNSMMFIAFDAEEQGLAGARHFVKNPVVPLGQIAVSVNMDMISTNFENDLYAVGTYHYPFLKPLVEDFTKNSPVNVLFGYDSEEWEQDWTMASDHGPFHQKGIPFIYFGVEDHEHYHQPTDTFENINPEFYADAVETIINVLAGLDQHIEEIVGQPVRREMEP